MIVLKAYGDYDYGAKTFEEQFDKKKIAKEMIEDNMKERTLLAEYDEEVHVQLYEFEDVDPDFIDFVRDFIDYDSTKHTDFYVIDF